MNHKCVVNNCGSKTKLYEKGVSFHSIYRSGEYQLKWIEALRTLNGQEIPCLARDMVVCSKHFEKVSKKNIGRSIQLLPNAVPTIFPDSMEQEISFNKLNPECSSTNSLSSDENIADPIDVESDYFNDIGYSDKDLDDTYNSVSLEIVISNSSNQPSTFKHTEIEDLTESSTRDSVQAENIEIEILDQPSTSNRKERGIENYANNIYRDLPAATPKNTGRRTLHQINEEATPQTLKRVNCTLIGRLTKKTIALKSSQRKVQRKNKQIESLSAQVFELKNKLKISENAVRTLQLLAEKTTNNQFRLPRPVPPLKHLL